MQKTSDQNGVAGIPRACGWRKLRASVAGKITLGLMVWLAASGRSGQAAPPTINVEPAIITLDVQLVPASGSVADNCLTVAEQMSQVRADAFSDQWQNLPQIYPLCPPWPGDSLFYPSIPLTGTATPLPASGRSATIVIPVNYYAAVAGTFPANLCLIQPAPADYAANSSVLLASGRKYYLFDQLPFHTGVPPYTDRFPAPNNRLVQEVPGVFQVRLLCPEQPGTTLRTITAVQVNAILRSGPQSGSTQARILGLAPGASVLDDVLFVRGNETYDVQIVYTSNSDDYLDRFTWGGTTLNVFAPANGPKIPVDCVGLSCLNSTPCADGSFSYFGHIVGRTDMKGGIIESPGTRVVADGGAFGNYRYANLTPAGPSGGGPFLLTNVMALGGQNYRVYANMSFPIGGQTEDFTTPCTTAHVDPCQTTDIGDILEMNPGYVTGNIFLKGFADTANCPCLNLLDLPGSRVRASGPCTGAASVTFGGTTTAGDFNGSYQMALAGLKPAIGQPDQSEWDPNVLALHFQNSGLGVNANVTITDHLFANQNIVAGATIPNNHEYCFSSVTFEFHNANPARAFTHPRISGTGSFGTVAVPATDFLGNPAAYGVDVSASGTHIAVPGFNSGTVRVCLPQGTYTITPQVNYPEGNATLPQVTFTVGCNEKLTIDIGPKGSNCCDNCVAPFPASYNVTVYPGLNYLVNHLCHGTNNLLEDVIPVVPEDSFIMKWNPVTQSYGAPIYYYGFLGWDGSTTLPPGEGFILHNPTPSPYTLTFTGCEPACEKPCHPTPTNGCSLVGRIGIGTATYTNLFACPPLCSTTVSLWNPVSQLFTSYTYVGNSWSPPLPPLPVGHSAFICVTPNTNGFGVICATNKTVECGQEWTFDAPQVTTNTCCGTNFTINLAATLTDIGPCVSTYTRIWQLTDCDSNSLTCTQVVTVVDTTPPVFGAGGGGLVLDTFFDPLTPSFASGVAPNAAVGQTFKVGISGTLVQVDLRIARASALVTSDLLIELRNTVAGEPDLGSPARASVTVPWTSVATGYNWMSFTFASGAAVTAGETLAIVMRDPVGGLASGATYSFSGAYFPFAIYPDGDAYFTYLAPIDWTPYGAGSYDYAFRTYLGGEAGCPTNKTVECGTAWSFDRPTAFDACCSNVTVSLVASNLIFSSLCSNVWQGVWRATDCCSNSVTCTQLVTVVDTTPPVIQCPTNRFVSATSPAGAVVNYSVTATDNCGTSAIVCEPPSGSVFPCGTNVVTCTATDNCGQSTNCSFLVVVDCPCLLVSNEQLTCTNTGPGQMKYSLDLFNNTGVPVKYVLLVPENSCFTASPDILTLNPPVLPGQSRSLETLFQFVGDCPSNLCFRVVALNSNLVECCSIRRCLDRTAGPRLVSVVPECGGNKITVTFDKPLDPATPLGAPNFIVDDLTHLVSLTYSSVSFGADLRTVCLFTVATLSPGTSYRLNVNNVRDTCDNPISPGTQMNFNCPGCVLSPMRIAAINGQIVISWSGGGHLECAPTVTGSWVEIVGATSPYSTPLGGTNRFYRVRCP